MRERENGLFKENRSTKAVSLSRVGNSHLAGGRKSGLTNQCAFGPQGGVLGTLISDFTQSFHITFQASELAVLESFFKMFTFPLKYLRVWGADSDWVASLVLIHSFELKSRCVAVSLQSVRLGLGKPRPARRVIRALRARSAQMTLLAGRGFPKTWNRNSSGWSGLSLSYFRRTYCPPKIRSFEKGLADRGGWRKEILHMPEIQACFLYPFSYAPLGEGGHISGEPFLLQFGGLFVANPCRQPLFETSDKKDYPPKIDFLNWLEIALTRRYPKLVFRINCRRNCPEMPLPNARAL